LLLSNKADLEETQQVKARRGALDLYPGEEVVIDLIPGEGVLASFFLFGLPIVGFLAGAFGGTPIAQLLGYPQAEWQSLAGGALGFSIPTIILAFLARRGWFDRVSFIVVEKRSAKH